MFVNYHTGAGNFEVDGNDLDSAKAQADAGAAYTQSPISIEDDEGYPLAIRAWCGTLEGIEDAVNPIQFGDFGYYADWDN